MKNIFTNILLTTVLVLTCANIANSATIVYPKNSEVTINSPRTFFIGSENPSKELKINDEVVEIHPSGGFWHTVSLEEGENTFTIDNGEISQIYKITRKSIAPKAIPQQNVSELKNPITIQTINDGVPIRSMPVDFGVNRLQHFSKGMIFNAVAEYGDFYKIQLARDDFAWILKDDVQKIPTNNLKLAKIESYEYIEEPNKRIFSLKLSKQVPYILTDNNGLDLVVYGVENNPFNKYELHIDKVGKMLGFNSYYKPNNELIIEIKNSVSIDKSKPLKGLKITIDAGHGGNEVGAIGCLGDKEKDINLSLALKLQNKLKKAGAEVYMTRADDSSLALKDRVKFANNHNSDIFISLHNNALPDSLADKKSSGSEIYYFYPQSRALAKTLAKTITKETGLNYGGIRQQSFAVIRNTQCLSVLVEVGYIINPDDNSKLIDDNFKNKVTDSILHGLEKYFNDVQ